ncbi:MAG: hypothetical protein ACKVOB_10870 [Sphingomonas sp.]
MTGIMPVLTFLGGSLAAVAVMVGLAAALGFWASPQIAGEADVRRLGEPYGGARHVAIDSSGNCALALLGDGRLLIARAMGNRIATRVLPLSAVAALRVDRPPQHAGIAVSLRVRDFSFPALQLHLAGNTVPDWLNGLKDGVRPS